MADRQDHRGCPHRRATDDRRHGKYVGLSELRRPSDGGQPQDSDGLLGSMGVTAYAVRMLIEGEWNGGKGKSMIEVLRMTPDQVWLCLCEMDLLKRKVGERRASMAPAAVAGRVSSAETFDGKSIPVSSSGKSKARQLMEADNDKTPKQMRAELERVGLPQATIDRMVAERERQIAKQRRKRKGAI